MSRKWIAVLAAVVVGFIALRPAAAATPSAERPIDDGDDAPLPPFPLPELPVERWPAAVEPDPHDHWHPGPLDEYAYEAPDHGLGEWFGPWTAPPDWQPWWPFRHSATHGRHIGRGGPMVGTSWRNRPYYLGGDLGALWLSRPINDELDRDLDLFGGIFIGCDWDHYWGSELAIHWGSPDLSVRDADGQLHHAGGVSVWTASMVYYPWGDSALRPYGRLGIGTTDLRYPTVDGTREQTLWTVPIGIGVKYPLRRWLAGRAELVDYIGAGSSGVATQHNLGLSFGLEVRFGAHPRSYWPWNPNRHLW